MSSNPKKMISSDEVRQIILENFGEVEYLTTEQYLQLVELTGLIKLNLRYHLKKLQINWKKYQKKPKDSNSLIQTTLNFVDLDETTEPELGREIEKEERERQKMVEKVFVFLSRARTAESVKYKFGTIGLEIFQEFRDKNPDGFILKQGESPYGEVTYYFEQIVNGCVEVKPRIFTIMQSENDRDYLGIIFPQDLDFSERKEDSAIRIIPIDSVTFGDHLCDLGAFKEVLRRLATKPYVFAFFNGNILGGSSYTEFTASDLRHEFKSLIAPVAHKILWAQSGNVEDSASNVDGVDPLRDVCLDLGIHHTVRPVRADVYWKDPLNPIEFYAIHGRSGAKKDGSKLNAILEVAKNQNFPHFTIMGHLEEAIVDDSVVYSADPTNNKIKESKSYLIICPGFRIYTGSVREIKGYTPPVSGRVECIIHSDNAPEATL
ncbi:MAG: hypothetical protein CO137_02010 [Candidatus Magasanikbacteria bacterium CG_4_9_14_3_um_filter_32_9]|uniref:Uncharacterized protein n=1 Tax=Candidatus Magasanikbacteria bacterium CG_4_9_14_3_um_filter_32_9 TaxID=1974644 RepID=A0A2M7Z6X0_9BACT|nr:MAG: hypothetical protein CO137_02010 [Candidatus Magasanikbacteria bacterium CG_4_9_14_3_um_filter_32_9]